MVVTQCDVVRLGCFHLHQVLWGPLSYILPTRTGWTDGRDIYGVASRVLFSYVFGVGTELPPGRIVTYCPKVGAGGGVLLSLFWRFVRECRVTWPPYPSRSSVPNTNGPCEQKTHQVHITTNAIKEWPPLSHRINGIKWKSYQTLAQTYSSLNQNTACTLKVPYQIRDNWLKITGFNGEVCSTWVKYYSHLIQLEICPEDHTTLVSCEISHTGKYDIIIPFGGWHHMHPLKNIETPHKWCYAHGKCVEQGQDGGIADMVEWD